MSPSWQVLAIEVPHGPGARDPRRSRARGGGWHIRAERTTGPAQAVSLCWLTATRPEYGITLLHG